MNDTVIDYVKWRGDITLKERPFNIIDNLILSELAYLDLEPLGREKILGRTLRSCYEEIQKLDAYRLMTINGGHQQFIEECALSMRFGSLIIEDYAYEFDPALNIQFTVVVFRMDANTIYVAYRGTDNTIIGWKEDFMLSFTLMPSQPKAVEFLKQTIAKTNSDVLVGGHSKGANLAVYACLMLDPSEQDRIQRIYMNDGPGFCKDVVDLNLLDRISHKITKIIPGYDVIGRLFEFPVEDTYIVKSYEKGIMQHDLISWGVDGVKLECLEKTDDASDYAVNVVNQWVEQLTPEQRYAFVSEFFDALAANGATTFDNLGEDGYDKVIASLWNASKDAKDTAFSLPAVATEEFMKGLEEFFKNSLKKAGTIRLSRRIKNNKNKPEENES